jgi:RNA polymerase sigma factor (sigma-70 family)
MCAKLFQISDLDIYQEEGPEGRRDIIWAANFIERVSSGSFPDAALDRELDEGLGQLLFMTGHDLVFEAGLNNYAEALKAIVRTFPEVAQTPAEVFEMFHAANDDNFRAHACRMAQLLGPASSAPSEWFERCLIDGTEVLKHAAIWAIVEVRPADSYRLIFGRLFDDSTSIRTSAAMAIAHLIPEAINAVPQLLSLLDCSDPGLRAITTLSLTGIALECPESIPQIAEAFKRLAKDSDPQIRVATATGLALLLPDSPESIETLLSAWKQQCVDDKTAPNCEPPFALGRDSLAFHIDQMAIQGADSSFDDFATVFLKSAFHPEPQKFIHDIVNHPWYRKVQLSQLRSVAAQLLNKTTADEILDEASQEFAVRLLNDPTLGLEPQRYRELAGYIRNHASEVAKLLFRRILRRPPIERLIDRNSSIDELNQPYAIVAANELRDQFTDLYFSELNVEEKQVILLWLVQGMTLQKVAEKLNLSVSQVRTHIQNVLRKVSDGLSLPADRKLLLGVTELFAADASHRLCP